MYVIKSLEWEKVEESFYLEEYVCRIGDMLFKIYRLTKEMMETLVWGKVKTYIWEIKQYGRIIKRGTNTTLKSAKDTIRDYLKNSILSHFLERA